MVTTQKCALVTAFVGAAGHSLKVSTKATCLIERLRDLRCSESKGKTGIWEQWEKKSKWRKKKSARSQKSSVQSRWSKKRHCVEFMSRRPCQTYCWGFWGTAAAEARLLAASLAFSDASFTESLGSRWGVSPVCPERDGQDRMRMTEWGWHEWGSHYLFLKRDYVTLLHVTLI